MAVIFIVPSNSNLASRIQGKHEVTIQEDKIHIITHKEKGQGEGEGEGEASATEADWIRQVH